ncbi:MAG: hypothetical protein R2747_03545 [Pyrinomonadaceae bacterium]
MKWLKFLLLLLALGVGAWMLLWLIGILYSLLWYVFWIGLIAIGGTVGYKLFLSGEDDEKPKLEEKRPIGLSEFEEADRALEEMKRKYLPQEKE